MQDDSSNFSKFFTNASVLKDIGSNGRNHSDEASGESNSHTQPSLRWILWLFHLYYQAKISLLFGS